MPEPREGPAGLGGLQGSRWALGAGQGIPGPGALSSVPPNPTPRQLGNLGCSPLSAACAVLGGSAGQGPGSKGLWWDSLAPLPRSLEPAAGGGQTSSLAPPPRSPRPAPCESTHISRKIAKHLKDKWSVPHNPSPFS